MDWEGIKTAYLDRERRRLGIPSREELAMKRVAEQRAAELAASNLETAGLQREQIRTNIETQPALRQAQMDAALARAEAAKAAAERGPAVSGDAYLMSLPPEQAAELARRKQAMAPPRSDHADRAAWTPQWDAGGNLKGFFHQGVFYPKENIPVSGGGVGVPGDVRRPLSAGEKSELALLDNPARLPDLFRQSLAQVRAAESESPVAAGTGIVMGNLGNVYRRFDTSGPGGDFDSARKQVRQVVYGLSGKQLNQSELQWLDSITPNLADPGVDEQINRFDAFMTALIEAKRQGLSDPFTAARLGFGIQRSGGGGAADPLEGRTATGPGGQKIIRKGGQWVPLQ